MNILFLRHTYNFLRPKPIKTLLCLNQFYNDHHHPILTSIQFDLNRMTCPTNSIVYNGSLCACPPGQLSVGGTACKFFDGGVGFHRDSGVDYNGVSFPETLFSFDSIKKFSQSQAVFLEATLVMMLSWLLMCFFLRFAKVADGRSIWFRLRWWISRLDVSFATRHWLVFYYLIFFSSFVFLEFGFSILLFK